MKTPHRSPLASLIFGVLLGILLTSLLSFGWAHWRGETMKLKHLLGIGAAVAAMHVAAPGAVMQAAEAQTTQTTNWTTGTVGSTTAGAAGTATGAGDGWLDAAGGNATAGSQNALVLSGTATSYSSNNVLVRPAAEASLTNPLTATFAQTSAAPDRYLVLRRVSANTQYFAGYTGNGTVLYIYRDVSGTLTQLATETITAPATGDVVRLTATPSGTASASISLAAFDVTTGTAIGTTLTVTDTSTPAALQSAGVVGLMVNGAAATARWLTAVYTVPAIVVATIAANDSGILYSPYNWLVAAGSAKTVNAGAYLRTIFSGTSCVLTTDTSANAAPYPQVWARVDNTSWTLYTLSLGSPSLTVATGLPNRKHLLEVVVKSLSYTLDRWTTRAAGLTLTGLTLDAGGAVSIPYRKPYNVLIYGDSITEALRTVSAGATPETNDGDALQGWAFAQGNLYDAEVGVVGFGATGISTAGQGGVPALPASYNLLWAGQARTFAPVPDLVIYNEGQNDGSVNITAAYGGVVSALASLSPSPRQILMRPFSGNEAANVQATAAAAASPLVTYLDTTGWWSTADSPDALHPYGYWDVGVGAPQVAKAVKQALSSTSVGTALALTITHDGTNQPVLTWNAAPSGSGYKVFRSTDGATYSVIATPSFGTLTYTDTARPTGATVYYHIAVTP